MALAFHYFALRAKIGGASTKKEKVFFFALSSAFTTLPLCGEDRMRLGNENKNFVFCFALLSAFTIFAFYE